MVWVLLPGFDGTGMLFEPFVRVLPKGVVPVVVRYPVGQKCSADALVDIVIAKLPESEPYILVAESFSGPIALKASIVHRRSPSAQVLCASFAKCPVPYALTTIMKACASCLPGYCPPLWILRRYLFGDASDEVVSLFRLAQRAVFPQVLAYRFQVLQEFRDNFTPEQMDFPLLYLQATRDRIVKDSHARFVQRRYPGAVIQGIEAPHLVLQVQPEASARAIVEFLRLQGGDFLCWIEG